MMTPEFVMLLVALVLTILIELGVLFLLGERRKRVLLSSVAVNVLTNVPLNIYLIRCSADDTDILVGEILVVVVETLWYFALVRKWKQAAVYGVLCNVVSFLTGLLLLLLFVYLHTSYVGD